MIQSQQITQYATSDGNKFLSLAAAESHETELAKVHPILARIPESNLSHGTYVQHDRETLLQIKRDLFALVLAKYGDSYPQWRTFAPDDVHPFSGVGRVLSEDSGPLASAWNRIGCFNFELGREYDQPYFANNPHEAMEAVA